ncbi:MAG: two-component regulator propeller domain-containing protein [Verrucomicrobiota bacterium]
MFARPFQLQRVIQGMVLAGSLSLGNPAKAVEGVSIPYSSRAWQTDEGLPQNSVHALAQTRDGFLWVGTGEGLARFDGVRFSAPPEIQSSPLKHATVTALVAGGDEDLWIGTSGLGLFHWRPGAVEDRSPTNAATNQTIHCLTRDRRGTLWAGTDQGLLKFASNRWVSCAAPRELNDDTVTALCVDDRGILRIATRSGLWSLDAQGQADADNFGIGPVRYPLKTVYADHTGRLWFGGSGGLRYVRLEEARPQTRLTDLRQQIIATVAEDRLGQHWVGTFRGLVRLQGDQIVDWPLNEKSPGDAIAVVFEDVEGSIWVGGRDGLYRLSPSRFVNYTSRQGLVANDVMSVCEDRSGAIWMASWVGGLSRLADGTISHITSTNGLTDDAVLSLHPARDGGLWVGMDFGRGLNKLDPQFQNTFAASASLINAPVRALHEQADGTLWVGTGKGLNVLRGGKTETYTTRSGLAGDNVMAICEDHRGAIWVGAVGGITRWESNQVTRLTVRDGLSSNFISSFFEDDRRTLWIGTKGGGLNRWRDGRFTAYRARDGLFSDDIFEVVGDDFGCLWMSCRRGIFRVSKTELEDFSAGKITRLNCAVFGRDDGLETVQCNGVAKPAGWKGSRGRLWFATIRGAVVVEPRIRTNERPPPVEIEETLADRELLPPPTRDHGGKRLAIPAGTREIELHYTALSFQAPEKNRFRYRLDQVDTDWIEAGNRRVANYYLIRPGTYRFEVTAANNDGVWNVTAATLTLEVLPHYWQTWWFKLTIVTAGLLVLAFLYRARLARMREIEGLRIRIASDLHDDVGSRLTKVAMVTESLNEQTPAAHPGKGHIQNIVSTVHDITLAMDEIVWTINPRNDTLDNLANYIFHYAQDYFQNTGVRCRLDLPPELPDHAMSTEERHNLFMAVKEALNNILKHAGATEVRIGLVLEGGVLRLSIADNGRGLEINPARPPGDGLTNMKQRLRQIGGRLNIESHPGRGTALVLELKIRGAK